MKTRIGRGNTGGLILLTQWLCLVVSMNACSIAKYELGSQESADRSHIGALDNYEPPMAVVIPRYYLIHRCGKFGATPCRDLAGERLYAGVTAGGLYGNITEHVPSKGLAVVVTVKQVSPEDYTFQIPALLTLFMLPAYTSREYELSYDVLLDFKKVREYQFRITEKAWSGIFMWLFAPIVPFLDHVAIGQFTGGDTGPMYPIVREATKTFMQAAREDGIL